MPGDFTTPMYRVAADYDIGRDLEHLARTQPAAPAMHVPGRATLSYAHLGEQIRYVRARLSAWEIGRGDIVVGVIPMRPEMAVACATVPGAATFAPLSPAFTTEVYCGLLARLRPKALIVPTGLDHPVRLAARRCGVAEIALVGDPAGPAGMFALELARHHESLRNRARVSREIAYVMCTSGTTGLRKLVPVTDRQVILYSQRMGDWCGLSAGDIGCHIRPLHLGGGLNIGLMVPWLRGMALVCLPESDVTAFFAALDQYRPTWLNAGFTIHRAILECAPAHSGVLARSGLRLLQAGSGRLEPDEIDRLEQLFRAPLLIGLSSSETHAITIDPPPPRIRKRGSVGLPLSSEVAILGDTGSYCAPGMTGEILVRGPLVFDGYLDDPQATAAAFVDGWFRTGDLGYFDEDGYLFLQDRVKDIINRGGEKISPMEIDSAIEALAGIRAAAAFGFPHPTLGEEVAAAVIKCDKAVIDKSDILEQVRQRMGPMRVPRRIYFVDELPRTETGKVRRSELAGLLGLDQVDTAAPKHSAMATASISPLEAALAGLWSSVLQVQVSDIGVNDDFFLLGGDSLRGARLLTSIKAVFGVDLPIALLFQDAATVAGMGRAIDAARSANTTVGHG